MDIGAPFLFWLWLRVSVAQFEHNDVRRVVLGLGHFGDE